MSYYQKPDSYGRIKTKLNYICHNQAKSDLKNKTGVDTSDFDKKIDLTYLKMMLEIDVDKLKTVLTDLNKIRNVVDNDVVKRMYTINL